MHTHHLQQLTYLWAVFGVSWSYGDKLVQSPCTNIRTCTDCIQSSCGWCFEQDYLGPRCFDPIQKTACAEQYIFNPTNELYIDPSHDKDLNRAQTRKTLDRSEDSLLVEPVNSAKPTTDDNVVQIKPQKIKLKLRKNQNQLVTFAYSRATDYPVDLYYLMDLSRSMADDKSNLTALANRLSATMHNMTSNFRIGFGSFVDKVVMPFVSMVPNPLQSSCQGCEPPYGFRNHMSLSKDTHLFKEAVSKAGVAANEDSSEGGFDAIMQATVCTQQIGWRKQARRLLVFSTDEGFHLAGDGKIGGIIEPNDGQCHMENNLYTHSTKQDYPSISQIDWTVKQHATNLIFAVTKTQLGVYEELSRRIQGSSVSLLSNNSDNAVELVREQYNTITSTIEMKDTSSDELQIVYYSSCLNDEQLYQTNKCGGLKVGDVVGFTAAITLKRCPKDRNKWKQTFDISPVGTSDRLTIELEMMCDCPCEQPGHPAYINSSSVCSGEGVSTCGVCLCNPGRYGRACECSEPGRASEEHHQGCKPANATTGVLCAGRGTCECGVCECNKMDDPKKVISGPFCECDNFSCERYKGQMCAGAGRGECVCGECACKPGYTGSACQCDSDQKACRSPENNEICSGNGKCVCGACVCNVDEGRHYSGQYCDQCRTCSGRCKEFKECVLCQVHKRGPLYNVQTGLCEQCTLVPQVEDTKIEANDTRNEHICSFYDYEECLYVYVYSYDVFGRLVIRAQKDMECPKEVPILGIIVGLTAAIVLVGLALLLVWKVVTSIQDRREFAKFEKERQNATWAAVRNPIYKEATSTFTNPTYKGK